MTSNFWISVFCMLMPFTYCTVTNIPALSSTSIHHSVWIKATQVTFTIALSTWMKGSQHSSTLWAWWLRTHGSMQQESELFVLYQELHWPHITSLISHSDRKRSSTCTALLSANYSEEITAKLFQIIFHTQVFKNNSPQNSEG